MLRSHNMFLVSLRSIYRTGACACAAINALVSVDYVLSFAL